MKFHNCHHTTTYESYFCFAKVHFESNNLILLHSLLIPGFYAHYGVNLVTFRRLVQNTLPIKPFQSSHHLSKIKCHENQNVAMI